MIDEDMLTQVIDAMPSEFNSHQVISEVTHRNQRDYILQLYAKCDLSQPFHAVHTKLGIDIKTICLRLGYIQEGDRNEDVFGQNSKCLHWRKPTQDSRQR